MIQISSWLVVCATLRAKKCFAGDNEEAPLRTPDQQDEISRHLFHNIAASWFPKAAGLCTEGAGRYLGSGQSPSLLAGHVARAAGAGKDSPLLPSVVCDPTG